MNDVEVVQPGSFSTEENFYPRVPNARLNSLVRMFLRMGNARIAMRYCHLHPEADPDAVHKLLATPTRWLRWAGADLFHVTDDKGVRRNVVIETNSSPSGQKSMPLLDDHEEQGGYRTLLQRTLLPILKRRSLPPGALAVLWDKNEMEVRRYAQAMADLTGEDVLLAKMAADAEDPVTRFDDGVLMIRGSAGWTPVRAAFRYVTQKPWTRIPAFTKTALLNPIVACLAGGRNKLLAAKAYDLFNAEMSTSGLKISYPETIWDVGLMEVPLWVARMGGVAVVKNPYSNAGQGVFTITSPTELNDFMSTEHPYERFIVQGLIGNFGWTSQSRSGRLYHVGTVPDSRGRIFAADLRFMVAAEPEGFYPIALYARRAREPLAPMLDETTPSSWDMLGTNLSVKTDDGGFATEPDRLMLMDERDFNRLGFGLDDLTEAYLQTVMSVHAIDQMASRLLTQKGRFRRRFFQTINPDPALLNEIPE